MEAENRGEGEVDEEVLVEKEVGYIPSNSGILRAEANAQ